MQIRWFKGDKFFLQIRYIRFYLYGRINLAIGGRSHLKNANMFEIIIINSPRHNTHSLKNLTGLLILLIYNFKRLTALLQYEMTNSGDSYLIFFK